ncbi:hypothetical protein LR010_01425, partial [Candidatus Gracilibacteria bacterium]|nr:hypothetical protein [Candidatus Gracilibacteria bacterium]
GENVSDSGSVISENVKEKTEDNNDEGENVSDSGSVISENVKEKNISVTPRSDLIGAVGDSSSSQSNNMMKKSGGSKAHLSNEAHLYASEVLGHSNMYPGINLETQVGMELEIGVHSLKLNNKYFNETLGYLMKGDSLTQLTQENNFGCFQVEVTNSTYSHNVGKTGYVCKKYLQAPEQTKNNTIVEDIIETNIGSTISTEIGDFIVVEKDNVMLGGSLLEKGAFIDKFSDTVNECFVAHVYKSINPANQGKVGVVCETNLY